MKTIGLENVLYDQKLSNEVATYVIDGVCVKRRWGEKEDLREEDIEKAIENYNSIGIQVGNKVNIYCNDDTLRSLGTHLRSKGRNVGFRAKDGQRSQVEKDSHITIQSPAGVFYIAL